MVADIFEEATFFCMLKGHTYTGLDQSFNTMMSHLKQFSIYTISKLVHHIWLALQKYDCLHVYELHAYWDWSSYFAPHVHERFGGFATGQYGSGMHEFRARKDGAGVIRMWVRKSSQASSWLPEGPGYPVFAQVPTGEPPLAKAAKTESEWKRDEVEGTLRSWFRFMTVKDQHEAAEIRDEWARVFKSLPLNDDTDALDPHLKPKWGELPKCASRAAIINDDSILGGASSQLENPPINPVTGFGRTTEEVQRETEAYRVVTRVANRESEYPAVFQADYLFVQLPGKPLILARVVHGCSLEEATSPELTFSVGEYGHTPDSRHPSSMLGLFTKAENPSYNQHDKRTGRKFIRHINISRAEVVTYDVRTFVDRLVLAQDAADKKKHRDCVRIAPSSLLALSRVRPEFTCPLVWPDPYKQVQDAEAQEDLQERAREEQGADADDPPPPIPANFEVDDAWETDSQVKHFCLWTKLPGVDRTARWHQGLVTKVYPSGFRGGYTHDAKFNSDGAIRGV